MMDAVAAGFFGRLTHLIRINHGTFRGAARYLIGQFEGFAGPSARYRALVPHEVSRLVFVCLGNINRSAFAEAIARTSGVQCASLGLSTTTGQPATDQARQVSAELGYCLDAHRATSFKDFEPLSGDCFVVMELRHAKRLLAQGVQPRRIILLGHWARPRRYHLHDPHTLSTDYFRSCFAVILPAVKYLSHELEIGGSPCVRR